MINQIIKRDGTVELFNPDKLNKWAEWASNINGVEWSSIALDAVKKCYDKCTTSDLQAAMIMACIDRADEAHLYMAGRLYAGDTYKIVFGDHTSIPSLKEMYHGMILKGLWANMNYSDDELDELNSVIDHSKDLRCIHSELKQIREKYSINDKVNGKCYETPQFMYMRVALASMNNQPADRRINDVKKVYTYLSDKKLNAPSPYMLHLGTPHRGLASCCVFASDDNIPSLAVGDHIAYMMTCASAGIGGTIFTRSKGDPVRGGTIEHMGKLPYLRVIEKGVNANVQAGRGGAATIYFNCLDPEISDLLRLRNPKTVAEKRIKDIDYGFSYNRYFLEKVARNEQWMLISYHYAKDLWDAMYSPNQSLFVELYQKYLVDETVPKELVSARDIAILFLTNSYEVGRFYEFAIDHVNTHTPFKDRINSSNLCVAPETLVLTKNGYEEIHLLENQDVDIWNGYEWSNVKVVKTGNDQRLITVNTDSGYSLECTPYHKFYIFQGYGLPYKEVRAHQLSVGDKLAKFDLPIIDGELNLDNAYINGFYSGDGCLAKEGQRVYLYHEKRKLAKMFTDGSEWIIQDEYNRQYKHYNNLKDKFFVPNFGYSIKSKLDWLAGYLDSDGCVYRNGNNYQLTASSVQLEFLKDVQLMLQTLGVSSKIKEQRDEGFRMLPANNGTGEIKEFWCQKSYRLLITSCDSYKLLSLGLKLNRLVIPAQLPQRDAKRFVEILSVVDAGRIDDTYCLNEPKRHMAMFNGILTGQCAEIALPTKPFTNMMDLYSSAPVGEIGLCNLMAIVAGRVAPHEYEDVAYYALLIIDNVIDIMEYPFPSLETTAKSRRSAGVGITNIAYDMAYKGLWYDSQSGKDYIHRLAEMHSYWLHRASLRLSKEKGICDGMSSSKYPDGWLPIDTYCRHVDVITQQKNCFDWESLRVDIVDNGGIRNSVLEAYMPCESSSGASNTANGPYPIREAIVIKTDNDNKRVFIAPHWEELKNQYQFAHDVPTKDMIEFYAILQKWCGQSISADLYHKYSSKGDERKIDTKTLINDLLYRHKCGMKSRYYINTSSGIGINTESDSGGCASGACKM